MEDDPPDRDSEPEALIPEHLVFRFLLVHDPRENERLGNFELLVGVFGIEGVELEYPDGCVGVAKDILRDVLERLGSCVPGYAPVYGIER